MKSKLFAVIVVQARKTHVLFAFLAVLSGLLFIQITPPLWGIDEVTHFNRVYQLSEGKLLAVKKADCGCYGDKLPTNLTDMESYVFKDLMDNNLNAPFFIRQDVREPKAYASYTKREFNDKKIFYSFTGAGTYSPLAYTGAIIGTVVAKFLNLNIEHTIELARIGTLVLYVALAALAIYLLRASKLKWLVFGVALIPQVIFQASIVSVDSSSIGESLLLFALLIRLWELKGKPNVQLSRRILASITVLAIILPLSKPTNIVLLLPILFIPTLIWRKRISAVLYKSLTLGASVVALAYWSLLTHANAVSGAAQRPLAAGDELSAGKQIAFMVGHPLEAILGFFASFISYGYSWIIDFFGYFGWNYVEIPLVSTVLPIFLAIIVLYCTDDKPAIKRGERPLAIIMIATGMLGGAAVLGAFYLAFTPVGKSVVDGIQGRYFLPTIIFILYGLTRLIPIKINIGPKLVSWGFPMTSALCLVFSAVVYYAALY